VSPETITAFATLITALGGAWVSLRRKLIEVHTLVNSQLEAVMRRLDTALEERDEARTERDDRPEP